jgi:hypothetical protein
MNIAMTGTDKQTGRVADCVVEFTVFDPHTPGRKVLAKV